MPRRSDVALTLSRRLVSSGDVTTSAIQSHPRLPAMSARFDAAMGLTLARVPLGVLLLIAVVRDRPLWAAALLTCFIGVDVVDGRVARASGTESDARRVCDGVIDRVAVGTCLLAGSLVYDTRVLWIVAVIWLREIALGLRNLVLLTERHTVMKASARHRSTSVGYAAFGYTLVLAPAGSMVVGGLALVLATVLLPPYLAEQRALADARP